MKLLEPTGAEFESCGIFGTRCWESNMPIQFEASDMVYLEEIPEIIREVFEINGCEPTSENFDLMTAAAVGMLEGYSLQTLLGDAEEKGCRRKLAPWNAQFPWCKAFTNGHDGLRASHDKYERRFHLPD